MGNSNCSDPCQSTQGHRLFQIPIKEFVKNYKSLKFPHNIAFTHDSQMFRIRTKSSDEDRILKRIVFSSEKELFQFVENLEKIVRLDHNNFLKVYNYSIERSQLNECTLSYAVNIVIESFHHTLQDELQLRIKNATFFKKEEIHNFLSNFADALEYIQLQNMRHGNMRPATLYITPSNEYKLLFLGEAPTSLSTEPHSPDISCLGYTAPQMRSQITESLLHEKVCGLEPLSRSSMISCDPTKADVFSLGLILLQMMSLQGVEGLNKYGAEAARSYRIIECEKKYGSGLRIFTEAMLKEDENLRPDFIDLKRMIFSEELKEFALERGVDMTRRFIDEDTSAKRIIEMKMIEDRSKVTFGGDDNEDSDSNEGSMMEMSGGNTAETIPKRSPSQENLIVLEEVQSAKIHGIPERDSSLSDLEQEMKRGIDEQEERIAEDELMIQDERDFIGVESTAIKKLVISLSEDEHSENLAYNLSKLLISQPLLNEIVISLPKANLKDQDIEKICTGITKVQHLKVCFLSFRNNQLTNEAIRFIKECLYEKNTLTSLGLDLSENTLIKKGCEELSACLASLENLESLHLNIGNTSLANTGLVAIGTGLGKLNKVTKLAIHLYGNETKGRKSITSIVTNIKKMTGLKSLMMDVSDNLLEDEDVEKLVEFLRENKMEEIEINLRKNKLSEEKIRAIRGEISNIETVKLEI